MMQQERVRTGGFSRGTAPAGPLKLLNWNIERGVRLNEVIAFIRAQNPALCLLQELDLNTRRSGRRDIAAEIARQLGYNYAWGAEFEELAQGKDAWIGNAILARPEIRDPRILRFKFQTTAWRPAWWKPWFLQPRNGGRMALAAQVDRLYVYSTHLESQTTEEGRRRQFREILDDAARRPPNSPVVIAGDFNTRLRPTPLLAELRQAGFRNALGEDYVNTKRDGSGAQDWVFVRGPVQVSAGRVHSEQKAVDHYPITVEFR